MTSLLYSGCPHMTSFTVQWGVLALEVLLRSGVSLCDKFYYTVGCPYVTSFTVKRGVHMTSFTFDVLLQKGNGPKAVNGLNLDK